MDTYIILLMLAILAKYGKLYYVEFFRVKVENL